jgi:hypothetical protein
VCCIRCCCYKPPYVSCLLYRVCRYVDNHLCAKDSKRLELTGVGDPTVGAGGFSFVKKPKSQKARGTGTAASTAQTAITMTALYGQKSDLRNLKPEWMMKVLILKCNYKRNELKNLDRYELVEIVKVEADNPNCPPELRKYQRSKVKTAEEADELYLDEVTKIAGQSWMSLDASAVEPWEGAGGGKGGKGGEGGEGGRKHAKEAAGKAVVPRLGGRHLVEAAVKSKLTKFHNLCGGKKGGAGGGGKKKKADVSDGSSDDDSDSSALSDFAADLETRDGDGDDAAQLNALRADHGQGGGGGGGGGRGGASGGSGGGSGGGGRGSPKKSGKAKKRRSPPPKPKRRHASKWGSDPYETSSMGRMALRLDKLLMRDGIVTRRTEYHGHREEVERYIERRSPEYREWLKRRKAKVYKLNPDRYAEESLNIKLYYSV